MLQVRQVGDKLVMMKGGWKIGGVGEFVGAGQVGDNVVKLVKVSEVGEVVKSWSIWSSLLKEGEVGEFVGGWSSWWKVGEVGES